MIAICYLISVTRYYLQKLVNFARCSTSRNFSILATSELLVTRFSPNCFDLFGGPNFFWPKYYLVHSLGDQKRFLNQTFLDLHFLDLIFKPKIFFTKILLDSKFFLTQNICQPKIFFVLKVVLTQNCFGPKILLDLNFLDQDFHEPTYFWTQIFLT